MTFPALPREPKPGQPVRASDITLLIRRVKAVTPVESPDIAIKGGSDGWVPTLKTKPRTPRPTLSAAADFLPFQAISFKPVGGDSSGDSGYNLILQPGVINGNIFPKVNGTPMWQMVETTTGGVTTFAFPALTVNAGEQVYLQGSVSAGVLTEMNIYSDDEPPDEDDNTTIYVIGSCDLNTGGYTNFVSTNLSYTAAAAYFSGGTRLILHSWGPG